LVARAALIWVAGLVILVAIAAFMARGDFWFLLVFPLGGLLFVLGWVASKVLGDDAGVDSLVYVAIYPLTFTSMMVVVSGPLISHELYGRRTEAIVLETEQSDDGEYRRYRIAEASTERDLGWMANGPSHALDPGDRVEVSVDRHGWGRPIAAERLGWVRPQIIVALAGAALTTILYFAAVAVRVQTLRPEPAVFPARRSTLRTTRGGNE